MCWTPLGSHPLQGRGVQQGNRVVGAALSSAPCTGMSAGTVGLERHREVNPGVCFRCLNSLLHPSK